VKDDGFRLRRSRLRLDAQRLHDGKATADVIPQRLVARNARVDVADVALAA
jgi:hypothetical protein